MKINSKFSQEIEELKGSVPYGKKKLSCDFVLVFNNLLMDLSKSKASCKPKPKKPLRVKKYGIKSEKNEFQFSLTISKSGKGKLSNPIIQTLKPTVTSKPPPTATPGFKVQKCTIL